MQTHMSKLRVDRALKHKTPAAANMSYKIEDQVLVWREKIVDSRIGEWLGPFTVDAIDDTKKIVYFQDERIGAAKPFNLAQLKRYYEPEVLSTAFFTDLRTSLRSFSTPTDDEGYLNAIIDKNDPRAISVLKQMTDAKKRKSRACLIVGRSKSFSGKRLHPMEMSYQDVFFYLSNQLRTEKSSTKLDT